MGPLAAAPTDRGRVHCRRVAGEPATGAHTETSPAGGGRYNGPQNGTSARWDDYSQPITTGSTADSLFASQKKATEKQFSEVVQAKKGESTKERKEGTGW